MCSAQSISKKMLHRSHPAEHSVWAQIHVHRVTDFEKFPVQNSKDEAPTPLPVVGPLFISPLSFHLSRAFLGAWRFGLFRCVYSSFHNRLDLIREPACLSFSICLSVSLNGSVSVFVCLPFSASRSVSPSLSHTETHAFKCIYTQASTTSTHPTTHCCR